MVKSPVDVVLGTRLRILREERGLSARDVGGAIGVSYQQVRKYELGSNRISAATLYDLALFLDVHVSIFFEALLAIDEKPIEPIPGAPQKEASFDLSDIDDPKVRQHLEGLLNALADKP